MVILRKEMKLFITYGITLTLGYDMVRKKIKEKNPQGVSFCRDIMHPANLMTPFLKSFIALVPHSSFLPPIPEALTV